MSYGKKSTYLKRWRFYYAYQCTLYHILPNEVFQGSCYYCFTFFSLEERKDALIYQLCLQWIVIFLRKLLLFWILSIEENIFKHFSIFHLDMLLSEKRKFKKLVQKRLESPRRKSSCYLKRICISSTIYNAQILIF